MAFPRLPVAGAFLALAALTLLIVFNSGQLPPITQSDSLSASPLTPATAEMSPQPTTAGGFPVIVAAGDIACAPDDPGFNQGKGTETRCQMQATADLVAQALPVAVLPLGDNQYERGELENFRASYQPTWGKFDAISRPVPGNHEYYDKGHKAAGYYDYFGELAGDRQKGYYSYDLGDWHLVALNSNCEFIGGCQAGSPQQQWLKQDLADHPQACTLAYWHHPRYSSGVHGNNNSMTDMWQTLYEAGADVVLSGHDHLYERFALQTSQGQADPDKGIRQFVIGTGGKSLYPFKKIRANSEVRADGVHGVLKLGLKPQSYTWQYLATNTKDFRDQGETPCH
ncbi:MAG: metallophosphoesterase family protein [Synechocystis sp.]